MLNVAPELAAGGPAVERSIAPVENLARGGSTPRSERSATPAEAPEATSPGETPSPVGSSSPVMLFAPAPAVIGLAGDGPNPFAGPSGPVHAEAPGTFRTAAPDAPSSAEAKRNVEQSLKSAMRARDADVGLGPEGPVLRALQDAAYGGLAPDRGNAMFVAVVDSAGLVVDVRLLSASGDGDWNDVRKRAVRALAGTKLALRGAKGAELKIAVDSDVRLPSGNRADERVRPSFSAGHVDLPDHAPSGGAASGAQTYTVGSFDVTDFQAKARRVVHARLVSLTTL